MHNIALKSKKKKPPLVAQNQVAKIRCSDFKHLGNVEAKNTKLITMDLYSK